MDLLVDSVSGDLVFVDGVLQTISGTEEVAQRIRLSCLTHAGEWFLDADFGVPWRERILVHNPNLTLIEGLLRAEINGVPGVVRINRFSLDYDPSARTLSAEYEVTVDPSRDLLAGVIDLGEL